jgi:hypothetical protein
MGLQQMIVLLKICGVEMERKMEVKHVIQTIQIRNDGEMMDVAVHVKRRLNHQSVEKNIRKKNMIYH